MATQRILCGGGLVSFDDTLCTLTPSSENGIQLLTITRNTGNVVLCKAWSGGLAHFPAGTSAATTVGNLTMVTVS